jgi:hypothetical protein
MAGARQPLFPDAGNSAGPDPAAIALSYGVHIERVRHGSVVRLTPTNTFANANSAQARLAVSPARPQITILPHRVSIIIRSPRLHVHY